jgi:alpha-tubulin suppressor-like RCC1 family protein
MRLLFSQQLRKYTLVLIILTLQIGTFSQNFYTSRIATCATGEYHNLAIDAEGNLWTWGYNYEGQLGDGTTVNKIIPTLIKPGTKFKAVAAGFEHSMALDITGKLWVWGRNYHGQVGNGTTTNTDTPIQIKHETVFTNISAGKEFSLAIDESGNLWAWGDNYNGQLGIETQTFPYSLSPIQIKPGTKFKYISSGIDYSLSIDEKGKLWAWGDNGNGQLGDGTTEDSKLPVQILPEIKFKAVSARNYHSLALDESGNIWSWGANSYGQLGDGTKGNRLTPLMITSEIKFKTISTGSSRSFAIDEHGNLWEWGDNSDGSLCDGTFVDKLIPVQIKGNTKFQFVSAASNHMLSVDETGNLWEFGSIYPRYGGYGGYGNVVEELISVPVKIKPNVRFKIVKNGYEHSIAIDESDNIWTWGYNNYGQLGDGYNLYIRDYPLQLDSIKKFKTISTGGNHTLAIDVLDYLWAWGDNFHGQLGKGECGSILDSPTYNSFEFESPLYFSKSPLSINQDTKFKVISAGSTYSLAIDEFGNLWTWGDNYYGQLCDGTNENRCFPVMIKSDTKFQTVSTKGEHTLAIDDLGNLWACGNNFYGQLGNGYDYTSSDRLFLVPFESETKFKFVSSGINHSMAIDMGGNIWACGINNYGQLGNGTNTDKTTFTKIESKTKFKTVSAGYDYTLAIDESDNLWVCGENNNCQLGDGTNKVKYSFVKIMSDVKFGSISAGYDNSFAIDKSGQLYGWGLKKSNLGIGIEKNLTPVWLNFGNNNAPIQLPIKAFGTNDQIIIQSDKSESFDVYNLLGRKVRSGKLQPGKISLSMNPGFYIFRTGDYRVKVLVN